jgi:hypothetical protein
MPAVLLLEDDNCGRYVTKTKPNAVLNCAEACCCSARLVDVPDLDSCTTLTGIRVRAAASNSSRNVCRPQHDIQPTCKQEALGLPKSAEVEVGAAVLGSCFGTPDCFPRCHMPSKTSRKPDTLRLISTCTWQTSYVTAVRLLQVTFKERQLSDASAPFRSVHAPTATLTVQVGPVLWLLHFQLCSNVLPACSMSKANGSAQQFQHSLRPLLTPAGSSLVSIRVPQPSSCLLSTGGARKPVHQRLVPCCSHTRVRQGEVELLGVWELFSCRVSLRTVPATGSSVSHTLRDQQAGSPGCWGLQLMTALVATD